MGIVVNDVPEGKGAHGEYAYYGVSRGYGYGRYYGYGRKRGYGYGYGYGADGDGEDDNGSDAPHRKVDEASQRGGDRSDSRAVDRDLR